MLRVVVTSSVVLVAMSLIVSSLLANRQARPLPVSVNPSAVAQANAQASASTSGVQGFGQIAIAPDQFGNYLTDVEIDGRDIKMVVDTGATYVSLTSQDADALGLSPSPSDFRYRTMTANGIGTAAKVHIDALRIANLEIDGVDAFVMQPGMLARSLLGMSALSRLGSVQISDGTLVLKR